MIAVAVGVLALPAAARADTGVTLAAGDAPATATAAAPGCPESGPLAGRDTWFFTLADEARTFVSVSAQYTTGSGTTTSVSTTPEAGSHGVSLTTDAGWTLVGASATVSGEPAEGLTFRLDHVCAAAAPPSPSPSPPAAASPRPSSTAVPSPVAPSASAAPTRSAGTHVAGALQPPARPAHAHAASSAPVPAAVPAPDRSFAKRVALSTLLIGAGVLLAVIAAAGLFLVNRRRS